MALMRRSVALFTLLLTLVASPAAAHTDVVSTTPSANESLTEAPTQVTITTREAVRELGSAIVVTGPSGARVDDGSTEIDGNVTLVGLSALSEFGTYTVDYRLLASDGHPIEGTFSFDLAEGGSTVSPSPSPSESTQTPTPEPTPSDGEQSAFPWWVLLAAAVALASAGALVFRSRR
jgi:methionine-rich copper-binding protein CopC